MFHQATWYNYINKLGWYRPRLPKKPKYETGIRANRPHQIWHAEITVVRCLNGMKYYVYLLMDNFSRFILNYQVSEKVSAEIRMQRRIIVSKIEVVPVKINRPQ